MLNNRINKLLDQLRDLQNIIDNTTDKKELQKLEEQYSNIYDEYYQLRFN